MWQCRLESWNVAAVTAKKFAIAVTFCQVLGVYGTLRLRKRAENAGCAVSSVVEHFLDTEGVRGSNPLSRTILPKSHPSNHESYLQKSSPCCRPAQFGTSFWAGVLLSRGLKLNACVPL